MSYPEINRVSQNLYLRFSPQRKYPPLTTTYCPPCPPLIPSRYPCYLDCCHCHCCCCCCYHDVCYNPCLHFDYSSSLPKKEENKKEEIKPEEKKPEENIKESQNQNEEIKPEVNEPPKEEIPEENNKKNEYENYEQKQFNDFMKKLMRIESQIEDTKIALSMNPDFNCEDAFRLFESNDKGYLDINDIKSGLNLIGLNPSDKELNLLMKRFDLQKNGFINYADFFDMVVPFEKIQRQLVEKRPPKSCCPCRSPEIFNEKTIADLKNLFELIIKTEDDVNNDRKTLGTLRLKLKEIFGLLDKDGKGYFDVDEMMVYFANNGLLDNNKEADLLFIRLDKNRNGKIDFPEVEDELQTLY